MLGAESHLRTNFMDSGSRLFPWNRFLPVFSGQNDLFLFWRYILLNGDTVIHSQWRIFLFKNLLMLILILKWHKVVNWRSFFQYGVNYIILYSFLTGTFFSDASKRGSMEMKHFKLHRSASDLLRLLQSECCGTDRTVPAVHLECFSRDAKPEQFYMSLLSQVM